MQSVKDGELIEIMGGIAASLAEIARSLERIEARFEDVIDYETAPDYPRLRVHRRGD